MYPIFLLNSDLNKDINPISTGLFRGSSELGQGSYQTPPPPPPFPLLLHFLTAYSIVMKLGTYIGSHKRNKMMRKFFHNG